MGEAKSKYLTAEAIWSRLDNLTKPPRSLGRLEELAARLCALQQTLSPRTSPRRLVLFAGDHGVVASGVSAWPSEVTGMMIRNILAGGAASSLLARSTGTELVLMNVGAVASTDAAREDEERGGEGGSTTVKPSFSANYRDQCIRHGTGDLALGPAMTVEEFERALEVGLGEARRATAEGMRIVAAGEMGIGNSTPAACLAMLLADVPLHAAVGRGAGADDATLARKRQVVEAAILRAAGEADPLRRMAEVAGFEIVAMAGFYLGAHAAGLTILLDGYIAGAAALIAEQLSPGVARMMIASHLSAEPGHGFVLERLGLSPFLDWNLRLGEGTGALLLMPLLDAAAAMTEMATFQELGIAAEART